MVPSPRMVLSPPPMDPILDGAYHAHLGPWELIEKPDVRPYYRAELVVKRDEDDDVLISRFLIMDPYDLRIDQVGLFKKIALEMEAAIALAREAYG